MRSYGGKAFTVRKYHAMPGDSDPETYVALDYDGDGGGHHNALLAKPEAIRFANALLAAVGLRFLILDDGRTVAQPSGFDAAERGGPDRPATLSDVDRILAAIREEVTDRPEPVITALQLLERVAAVIESAEVAETVETARTRLAVLAELAHLANVAMGRAPIVPIPE